MYIKQISVFVENTTGRLSDFTGVLSKNNIDMKALCIADTVDFGILRCIVDDPDKATKVLGENGFTASITKVLAVEMKDVPGGLHEILEILQKENIGVDYVYSIIRSRADHGVIVLKIKELEKGGRLLKENNIQLYCQEDLS